LKTFTLVSITVQSNKLCFVPNQLLLIIGVNVCPRYFNKNVEKITQKVYKRVSKI